MLSMILVALAVLGYLTPQTAAWIYLGCVAFIKVPLWLARVIAKANE